MRLLQGQYLTPHRLGLVQTPLLLPAETQAAPRAEDPAVVVPALMCEPLDHAVQTKATNRQPPTGDDIDMS